MIDSLALAATDSLALGATVSLALAQLTRSHLLELASTDFFLHFLSQSGYEGLIFFTTSITAPQNAHKSLVLQVYLGSDTLEFSAIRR